MTYNEQDLELQLITEMLSDCVNILDQLEWPEHLIETCGNISINSHSLILRVSENKFAITDTNTDI